MSKTKTNIPAWLIFLFAGLLAGGCTQNGGHIGSLFGRWKLTEITVNGHVDADYRGNIFWAFQGNKIQMLEMTTDGLPDLFGSGSWGTWEREDGYLILNFSYTDDSQPEGGPDYTPPAATHLPAEANIRLKIDRRTSNQMTLTYPAPSGIDYGYKLEKY